MLNFPELRLCAAHLVVIAISNYAVQLPVTVLGIETTWGTFTYPLLYVTTDLTVRLFGARRARRIVALAMLPALLASYVLGTLFAHGTFQGADALGTFSMFMFRIALASFCGYAVGQLLDITVFARLRRLRRWYVAPAASSVAGNLVDTALFYFIAFHACSDPYLAENYVALGVVDYCVKLLAALLLFVPLYGALLRVLTRLLQRPPGAVA